MPFSIEGVTSSSVFLGNATVPPSQRGCIYLQLPLSTELYEFQAMSDACRSVTPMMLAYYGGVPSLLYCSFQGNELSPGERFDTFVETLASTDFNDTNHAKWFYEFVHAFLHGKRIPLLSIFDRFCSIATNGNYYWPPCYMLCICKLFHSNPAARALAQSLERLVLSSEKTETGLDWEILIETATILHCCEASQIYCGGGPLDICKADSEKFAISVVRRMPLPAGIFTVSAALDYIRNDLRGEREIVIAVCSPVYSKFPSYDCLIAYHHPNFGTNVYGLQMKLGRAYPKDVACEAVQSSFLMRGNAPESENQKRGWTYMSEEQLKKYLGFSLSFLYPASLLAVVPAPTSDDFDC